MKSYIVKIVDNLEQNNEGGLFPFKRYINISLPCRLVCQSTLKTHKSIHFDADAD